MSGEGRLDAGLEAGISPDRESYASGSQPCDPALVEGCISDPMDLLEKGWYLSPTDDDEGLEFFRKIVGTCTARLRPHVDKGFGHQAFLDTLVAKLEREATPFHVARLDTLFSPVLQALYSLGRNGFDIDLTSLPGRPFRMLTFLEGKPENPLRLCYRGGPVFNFGERLSYCSVEAAVVVDNRAGKMARNCDMSFFWSVRSAGLDAYSSTFHVRSVSSVPERADNCAYYLAEGIPDDDMATWWPGRLDYFSFFKRGNSLYVPDGEERWKMAHVTLGQHGEVTVR